MKLTRYRFVASIPMIAVAICGLATASTGAVAAWIRDGRNPILLMDPTRETPLEWFLLGTGITAAAASIVPRGRSITIGRLMIAIATVALILGAIQRRNVCESRRLFHLDRAGNASIGALNRFVELGALQPTGTCAVFVDPAAEADPLIQRLSRRRRYHTTLADNYLNAICRPWVIFGPDPPPPD